MKGQKGFSAVALLLSLILVVAIGFTGYFVWNTQNNKKDDAAEVALATDTKISTTPSDEEKNIEKNKVYETPFYSFEYPESGWNLEAIGQSYDPNLVSVELKTTEYEAGMGPNVGALVSVLQNKKDGDLTQEKKRRQLPEFGATNFKDLTVGGVGGFSYETSYEGKRYRTFVVKDDKNFEIIYMHEPSSDYYKYANAYEMIVKTFKFK